MCVQDAQCEERAASPAGYPHRLQPAHSTEGGASWPNLWLVCGWLGAQMNRAERGDFFLVYRCTLCTIAGHKLWA